MLPARFLFWEELKLRPLFDGYRATESEWLTRDGRAIPVEKRVTSYEENGQVYWVIHAEDLTRQRQIAQEQVHLASQLQSSLEATAEGILSVDLSGKVISLNRRFVETWAIPDELIVARVQDQMMAHIATKLSEPAIFANVLKQIQIDPESETEDTISLLDGRHFVCVSKPEYLRDRLIGRVFSVRDITSMKNVERDLVAAKDLAELASQEKSMMLEALEVSENRLRRLINSSLIGIFRVTCKAN